MSGAAPFLSLEHIVKRFGTVVALRDASLHLRRATVHALLGENGAGKTTLMRIAFGMMRPDDGIIRVAGAPRAFRTPAEAIAGGIGMVHQHFSLVPAMTVAENVSLGGRGRFDRDAAASVVERVAKATGFAIDPSARVAALSVAQQQRVEIVKALAHEATTLILDEPTAVLAPVEARDLLQWLRRFADGGGSVVLITHKLRDALTVADDVTVLRRGVTALAGPTTGVDERALLEAMLGGPAGEPRVVPLAERTATVAMEPVIVARDVDYVDERGVTRVAGASLEVRAGEILGVAAVEGAGHRELLRILAGRSTATGGQVVLPPAVGFIPEDRHREAVILEMSLQENVALRGAGARRGRIDWPAMEAQTRRLVARFEIVAEGPRLPVRELSGGNQQRLVVARELGDLPPALIAENPTRGLDVRAAAAVQSSLRDARARGVAIVFYSSDLDEVLALADRMVVVHATRVRDAPLDREAAGRMMVGA